MCAFDFEQAYGDRGADYIEAHHKIPLSELTGETRTRPSDLAMLCANCHRMIHAKRPWLTINELKELHQHRS